jgi:hypothetical protein
MRVERPRFMELRVPAALPRDLRDLRHYEEGPGMAANDDKGQPPSGLQRTSSHLLLLPPPPGGVAVEEGVAVRGRPCKWPPTF